MAYKRNIEIFEEAYLKKDNKSTLSYVARDGRQRYIPGSEDPDVEAGGSGIESIEQTVTSDESGGVNVVTITTSDGTTTDFEIRNGKQGDKGDQGNSGFQGDFDDFEVVNNLTDGGESAALSAEMGKVLGKRVVKNPNTDQYDVALEDEDGYVLVELSNGHIRTKNFDSSNICANEAIQKAVFMGDSITHGVYSFWHNGQNAETDRYNGFDITNMSSAAEATAYHGIHYFFGKLARCANVVNLGKRGTGYVADTRNLGTALQVANGYDFSDVDFVALCFGVNDYIQGKTIGDITTQVSGTVIGNMCATIEKILTDNPLCKVVAYSPYNTWGQVSYGGDYTASTLYGDESTNYALGHKINGNTLQDIINAQKTVCDFYGIQLVNLSQSNVINRFTIKEILIDGLHPSKASYIKLAAEIYGKGNFGD